ncbi:MAG TPA: inositol monophosphatase family protein [Pirellulales bacterium]|jgi:myo-inositol-1(or 4)-monophosphatase|nr:inositol monophosphatase family protein [Pirellulales bacterium]
MAQFGKVCEEAAKAGGEVLLDWAGRFHVREKGRSDLVTEADVASQEVIRDKILAAFPGHGFLAEENEQIASREEGLRWIVDPLDGTMNYVHGVPSYSVSIALEQRGTVLVGTVYDPVSRECFSAVRGRGSWLNGASISVSAATSLSEALVAVSFAAHVRRGDPELAEFIEVMLEAQGTRRMGSSALNLCYLAAGRFDAYWSKSTKIWDIAAGALVLSEAGGLITAFDGGPLELAHPQFIAAATPQLHNQLRAVLLGKLPAG